LYEGTQHGFRNDSAPRYNEAAANLALQCRLKTIWEVRHEG